MVFKKKTTKKPEVKKVVKKTKVEKPEVEEVIKEPKVEEVKEEKVPESKIDGRKFGNETILSIADIVLNGKKIKEIKTVEGQSYRHSSKDLEVIIERSK